MNTADRRQTRTSNRAHALSLLLDACRARAGLDALVLADRDGLLLSASASGDVDPEVVAAHLPRTDWRTRVPALTTRTLKLDGRRLFVGAVGAVPEEASREIYNAMRGAQRILG